MRFVIVTREHFAGKKWRRPDGYHFAAKQALVPIVGAELARAALSMPVAFSQQSRHHILMGVLSLTPDCNMFIGPEGRWLGSYVPAWLRAYPFSLMPKPGTGDRALGVDMESGLVVEGDSVGEKFFDDQGAVSSPMKAVIDFLTGIERSRKDTVAAVAALAEAGAITPWQIKRKTQQGEHAVEGLHRIDEAVLGTLSDEFFLKLRKASALPVAYAQLLSMGQLGIFDWLARVRSQMQPAATLRLPENLDSLLEMPDDSVIRFR